MNKVFKCILQNQEYRINIDDEVAYEYLRMHQFELSDKLVSCVNWYIYSYPYVDTELYASCIAVRYKCINISVFLPFSLRIEINCDEAPLA